MKKRTIITYIIIVLFSLIICYGYIFNEHLATDTFNIMNLGYEKYSIEYSLTDGRVVMALIGIIANSINMPIHWYVAILEVLSILVSCTTVMVLKNIVFSNDKKRNVLNHILMVIACYCTIFNYTFIENMYFVECFVMSLSILMYTLAANKIVNINRKTDYLKTLAFIFIGLICYQGTISAFFIMLLLFTLQKDSKMILKNFIIAGSIFIIGVALNSAVISIAEKIFNTTQNRGIDFSHIISNILYILKSITTIISYTSYLMPRGLYTWIIILFIIGLSLKVYIPFKEENSKIMLGEMGIIVLGILFAFIPSCANLTGFWQARMRFSMGAVIGVGFIYLIAMTDVLQFKRFYDKILIAFLIIYAVLNSANYMYLISLSNKTNKIDEKYAKEISEYILEYEETENIKVENIAKIIIKGPSSKAYYSEIACTGAWVTTSSIKTDWSYQGAINYYTGRNLQKTIASKEMIAYYKENLEEDRDYLCFGNTLYMPIYMY